MDCYMLHLLTVQDLKRYGRKPCVPRRREGLGSWRLIKGVTERFSRLGETQLGRMCLLGMRHASARAAMRARRHQYQ